MSRALEAAGRQGNIDTLQLLLDFGADLSMHGCSTTKAAIGNDDSLEFLKFLLDAWTLASDGDLNWATSDWQITPLEIATGSKNRTDLGLTRILLDYKAPGKSEALRLAVRKPDVPGIELVKILLAAGAEVGHLDDDHSAYASTALQSAASTKGCVEPLRLLLEHRTTTRELSEAFQSAACSGNLDSAQLLLDHGVDINTPLLLTLAHQPRTALQLAAENGDLKTVRFLLEAGAHVESKVPSRLRNSQYHQPQKWLMKIKIDMLT